MKVRTKRKINENKRLELENKKYQQIIEQLQDKIKYDDYLKKENEKLIDWVQKILEQFGTIDVRSRDRVQKPVMKNFNNWSDGLHNEIITTETIIIPEISIRKIGYRR